MVHQTVRTANTLLKESRRLFRPAGLSEAQFNVLNVLAQKKSDLSQSELSEILVVDRSNVTGLLDRMEKSGWVVRRAASGDRRKYHIQLTPAGRKLWRSIYPKYEQAVVAAVGAIGSENARRAIDTLARLEQAAKTINQPN
jgi:MarR family 2-MHQ and catechol resistance regulon transcriptional repressor